MRGQLQGCVCPGPLGTPDLEFMSMPLSDSSVIYREMCGLIVPLTSKYRKDDLINIPLRSFLFSLPFVHLLFLYGLLNGEAHHN